MEKTDIHNKLQESLKKEVETMRELLANMRQEEISLLTNDRTSWNHVMEQRAQLIAKLSDLRTVRIQSVKQLEAITFPTGKPEEVPLEELLPSDDENSCETLSLRDQMMALIDRMNLQLSRNEMLSHVTREQTQPQPQPMPQEHKKKISIATYPPEEYDREE